MNTQSQGRAAAVRRAHTPEVAGSIPALATRRSPAARLGSFAGCRCSMAAAGLFNGPGWQGRITLPSPPLTFDQGRHGLPRLVRGPLYS